MPLSTINTIHITVTNTSPRSRIVLCAYQTRGGLSHRPHQYVPSSGSYSAKSSAELCHALPHRAISCLSCKCLVALRHGSLDRFIQSFGSERTFKQTIHPSMPSSLCKLHDAATSGSVERTVALLSRGSTGINRAGGDNGWTSLIFAAYKGSVIARSFSISLQSSDNRALCVQFFLLTCL